MPLPLPFYKRLITALISIPLFLHIFGLTMVYKTRSRSSRYSTTTTTCFLICLSVLEIILILLIIPISSLEWESELWWYFAIYLNVNVPLQILSIFTFMTLEKFFRIYLGLSYPLYWNVHSTKRLLAGTIITWNVATVPLLIFKLTRLLKYWNVYILPFCNVLGLIQFIACYSYIFWKVKKSRLSLNYGASSSSTTTSTTGKNRPVHNRSQTINGTMLNYRVPFLIVSSFFLLIVMPQFFIAFTMKTIEESLFKYTLFFSIFNVSIDALVYIWLTPRIRKGVITLFSCCCCCRKQRIIEIRSERRPTNTFSTV